MQNDHKQMQNNTKGCKTITRCKTNMQTIQRDAKDHKEDTQNNFKMMQSDIKRCKSKTDAKHYKGKQNAPQRAKNY